MRASATATGPIPCGTRPITRSPVDRPVTSGPTSVTTPATSLPIRAAPGYIPNPISTSRKFTPAARTASRTRPAASGAPTSGHGTRRNPSNDPDESLSNRQHDSPTGGVSTPSPSTARTSRGASTRPSRTATCDSPAATAVAIAVASVSVSPSRSTSMNLSGCSDCAERTNPHTGACTKPGTASSGPTATAPRVTTASRTPAVRSSASHRCRTSRVTATAPPAAAASPPSSAVPLPGE